MMRTNPALAILCAAIAPSALAEPLHVPAQYPTIQAAIDAWQPGDEIHIAPGIYRELLSPESKSLTLIGAGPGQTILSGDLDNDTTPDGTILDYQNQLGDVLPFITIRNLTMTDADAGVRFSRAMGLDIASCDFVRCEEGGVRVDYSPGGTLLFEFTADQCRFEGPGGGISLQFCDVIDVRDCVFEGLTRTALSGAGKSVTLTGSDFLNCSSGADLFAENALISRCTFEGNVPLAGSFVYASAIALEVTGPATIEHSDFRSNGRRSGPPALRAEGSVDTIDVIGCEFDANVGSFESAVAAYGVFRFESCVFTHNVASGTGPINLFASQSKPTTIANCEFRQNGAVQPDGKYWPEGGGGFCIEAGTVIVRDTTFVENIATTAGAIMVVSDNGGCIVERSTFIANRAGGSSYSSAGAIYAGDLGRRPRIIAVSNSAFIGNDAGFNPGGAIVVTHSSVVTSSVFIGNRSKSGSVVYREHSESAWTTLHSPLMTACIVVTDSDAPPFDSTFGPFEVSATTNLITPSLDVPMFTRPPSHGGDGYGDNPLTPDIDESLNDDLGDLTLLPGSPAIDAGVNTRLPRDTLDLDRDNDSDEPLVGDTDLAGNPRFTDDPDSSNLYDPANLQGPIDLGPYEYQPADSVSHRCPADTNNDGAISPADLTAWISAFNAKAEECDQNADGSCTAGDFSAWIANFNAGC